MAPRHSAVDAERAPRGRAESEAIAIMEADSTRGIDSEWLPIGDFQSDPLDSTHRGAAALNMSAATTAFASSTATEAARSTYDLRAAIDSKLAGEKRATATARSRSGMIAALLNRPSSSDAGGASAAHRDSFTIPAVVKVDPRVTLFNRKHAGLLLSVAFASLLSTWLKRGVLPLMQTRLRMEQYQVDAAELLLLLPWSCSFVLGFCSDIFPMFGSHRKAYMILGWVLSATALAIMAALNHSNRFDTKLSTHGASVNADEKATIVGGYVFLLGAACFGEILSIMMAEIYVIAFSKREVLLERGHMVGTFLLVQFGFQGIGQVITDTAIFHIAADGSLQPHLAFQDVIVFLAIYSLLPIPIILYFFDDRLPVDDSGASASGLAVTSTGSDNDGGRRGDDDHGDDDDSIVIAQSDDECEMLQEIPPSHSATATRAKATHTNRGWRHKPRAVWTKFTTHWRLLWSALEEKATWQIVCFLCVFIFFSEFTLRYPFLVLDQWTGVTAKTISTGKIFTELMFFLAVFVWKGLCVNTHWSTFVTLSYLGVFIFPPMTYFLLVTFSVGRSLTLYMFVSSCQGFIRALAVVLEVVMMIEIAPHGGEGAVLGTVVSIAAIMRLVSQTFSNSIGYLFGTQLLLTRKGAGGTSNVGASATAAAETRADDEPMLVATALLLCYTLRLLALIGVLFLPSQKLALRRLLIVGGRKRFRAWWTLGILLFALLLGTLLNSLVITPETMCLHMLGGSGCKS